MMDYCINPVKMSGRITATSDRQVKINMRGRLGVITVADRYVASKGPLRFDHELAFYFSYIQLFEKLLQYDLSDMNAISDVNANKELVPCLLEGTITEVNDTAVRVATMTPLFASQL